MSSRRRFLTGLGAGLLVLPEFLVAETTPKTWRLGFLSSRRRPDSPESEPNTQLPRTLQELGYVEGRNLVIEWRFASGDYSLLPGFASELVRLPVDILVTDGTPGIRALQASTKTIPIVFAGGSDLLASGIVKSLARPGGNATGITLPFDDTTGKLLELLRDTLPAMKRVAVLLNPENPASRRQLAGFEAAALRLKVTVVSEGGRNPEEIEAALARFASARCDGLALTVDAYFFQQRLQIAGLANRHRLPSISGYPEFPDAGGMLGYGPDRREIYRRVAILVDRVLKGANPGDIPIEQPTKLDLVINQTTAKALGVRIPPEVLLLATRVVG